MYLYYRSISYEDLSPEEKKVGEKKEYELFVSILEENQNHKYRKSLWKSKEEYLLFLGRINEKTKNIFTIETINEKFINLILWGKQEEFEDTHSASKENEWDMNAVYLSHSLSAYENNQTKANKFNEVFGFFGDGLVISIYKQNLKDFSDLNILFQGLEDSIVRYGNISHSKNISTEYFPYIFYSELACLQDDTREKLLEKLEEKIVIFISQQQDEWKSSYKNDLMLTKGKNIRDNVHGDIFIDDRFLQIIDTSTFQRLRRIKQLATSDYVYPGASHTRFAHSIGTFHIMSLILDHFCTLFNYLKIEYLEIEKDAVLVAALLHDVGHGPYSHTFENIAKDRISHEEWTKRIISSDKELNKVFNDAFHPDFRGMVLDCIGIENDSKCNTNMEVSSLKDIFKTLISSQFDADRLDYLMRDSSHTGIKFGKIDLQRLIYALRLTEYNGKTCVCFDSSALSDVEHFLIARYNMYDTVYSSPYKLYSEELLSKIGKRISQSEYLYKFPLLNNIYKGSLTVEDYLKLDDIVFQSEIQNYLKESDDDILKDMMGCFYQRRGYERLRIFHESMENNITFLQEFKCKFGKNLDDYQATIHTTQRFMAYDNSKPPILMVKGNGITDNLVKISNLFVKHNWEGCHSYLYLNRVLLNKEIAMELGQEGARKKMEEINKFINEYDIRAHTEIEQKYSCCEDDIKRASKFENIFKVNELKCYVCEESKTITQEDEYYDTEDFLLARNDYSFRCRKINDNYCCTVKTSIDDNNNKNNGQFIRSEFEESFTNYSGETFSLKKAEHFAKKHLSSLFLKKDIDFDIDLFKNVIKIKNNRKIFQVKRKDSEFLCEICLDSVEFCLDGNSIVDYQIEIELKSTNPIYRVELRNFAKLYQNAVGLDTTKQEVQSKYIKALSSFNLL